jgi:hypothetical protein
MQGDLKGTAGDWLAVGYHFKYAGQHPASTVTFQQDQFTFPVTCTDGSTPTQSTLVVTAPDASYAVGLNDTTSSFPADSGAAAETYEMAMQLPNWCGTKANNLRLKTGGTFTSLLSGTDTTDKVQIQWHYVDTGAGKPANSSINCSSLTANPDPGQAVCNGGWSGTLNTTPGTATSAITFQCQLDGSGFSPCGGGATGTITYPGPLSVGNHTFQVEAVVAGTPSAPTSYPWTIIKNSPTLALSGPGNPGSGAAGTSVPASSLTATLASAFTPATGAITFTVFGPSASAPSACTSGGTTIGSPVNVSGNTSYHPTADFTPTVAGNYWLYASYPGDANNNSAASTCPPGAAQEIVVGKASPTLSVSGPAGGTAGTAISGSAISAALAASSGTNATGTITFKYFQQSTAPSTCTSGGTTIGTAAVTAGNGNYSPNAGFTPTVAGNYWLYASYPGDANNNNAASACPPVVKVVVGKASPTLTVSAPASLAAGSSISAAQLSATLSGSSGSNANSPITYTYFGPSPTPPTTCTSGGTVFGATTPTGDGTYHPSSGSFTPNTAGTYWWYVSSAGDSNNNAATSTCNSTAMTKTVVANPTGQLTISGNAVGTLYPGGVAQPIATTFTNPNSVPVDVQSLTVTVASTGVPGCSTGYFQITQSNITTSNRLTVPANGSATIPTSGPVSRPMIRMVDSGTNQDACQGAHLTLNYSSN